MQHTCGLQEHSLGDAYKDAYIAIRILVAPTQRYEAPPPPGTQPDVNWRDGGDGHFSPPTLPNQLIQVAP